MAKFFIEHPFELKGERSRELGIHIQMRQYGIYEFVFVLFGILRHSIDNTVNHY